MGLVSTRLETWKECLPGLDAKEASAFFFDDSSASLPTARTGLWSRLVPDAVTSLEFAKERLLVLEQSMLGGGRWSESELACGGPGGCGGGMPRPRSSQMFGEELQIVFSRLIRVLISVRLALNSDEEGGSVFFCAASLPRMREKAQMSMGIAIAEFCLSGSRERAEPCLMRKLEMLF